jgi:nucleotide-binding universal stress UspA family protein
MEGKTKIVVGIDGSPGSDAALRWALGEGKVRNEPVEVVHCWNVVPPYGGQFSLRGDDYAMFEESALRLADEMMAEVEIDPDDKNVRKVVRFGSASEILIDESRLANLLVVGARGKGGFMGLRLGSVATKVAAHALCNVVVVPAASSETRDPLV